MHVTFRLPGVSPEVRRLGLMCHRHARGFSTTVAELQMKLEDMVKFSGRLYRAALPGLEMPVTDVS